MSKLLQRVHAWTGHVGGPVGHAKVGVYPVGPMTHVKVGEFIHIERGTFEQGEAVSGV